MTDRPREQALGTLYTLLAAAGFGAVSSLTAVAMRDGVSLSTVLTWRYVLASVVLTVWVGAQSYRRMPPREMIRWLAIGGGGQALLVYCALSSLAYIPAATLAFLFYTYPAWVTLVQAVRGAERFDARRGVALALSLSGTAFLVGNPASGTIAWKGVALALGAAAMYGAYIPAMQAMQRDWPVPLTSAYSKIGAALCFLALAVGDGSFAYTFPAATWTAIVTLTLVATVLPSLFFLMGLLRLGPVRTAIISTVEPVFTAAIAWAVLAQKPTPAILAGGALIVGAVVLLQWRRERVM
ncbi:MAG: DMT family transporter [Gemmatimonadaceae bacterium]|nr:DMT family transporter [Gemmatimonadaceae bacterium]